MRTEAHRPWKSTALGILVVASLAYGQVHKDAETKPVRHNSAVTPEEAFQCLVEAAAAGDVDAYLALLDEPSRQAMTALVNWYDAIAAYRSALDQKFGKVPNAEAVPSFKDSLKSWKTEIIGEDSRSNDRVVFRIKWASKDAEGQDVETENKLTAVKEGSTWKLRLWNTDWQPSSGSFKAIEMDTEEAKRRKENTAKWTAAILELTKQVKEGKYQGRSEAEKAFANAQRKLVPKTDKSDDGPGWIVRGIGLAGIAAALFAYFKFRRRQLRH